MGVEGFPQVSLWERPQDLPGMRQRIVALRQPLHKLRAALEEFGEFLDR
jgi:hypothetical protein